VCVCVYVDDDLGRSERVLLSILLSFHHSLSEHHRSILPNDTSKVLIKQRES
jgi:hypothetical protein